MTSSTHTKVEAKVSKSPPTRSFNRLLEDYSPEQPKRGHLLNGKVLHIEGDAIILDVGAKRDAIVPRKDVDRLDQEQFQNLKVGDKVPVFVLRTPSSGEKLLVSITRGLQQQDWLRAEDTFTKNETLNLNVIDQNRGGLLVHFGHLRGFVPNSHIPGIHTRDDQEQMSKFKENFIGTPMRLKIIEVDRRKRRLILSGRKAQQEGRDRRLQELKVGQVLQGRVVNIVDFGAFVDLGGIDGLIHISELDWRKVNHPSEVLNVGEKVDVQINSIDLEKERIGLSRKALLPNPWDKIEQQYKPGDLVEGEIANVCHFGIFVRIPEGIEGLIHQSEMDIIGAGMSTDLLRPGDAVLTRILHIDSDKERMSLSLKQVTYDEQVEWMEKKEQA